MIPAAKDIAEWLDNSQHRLSTYHENDDLNQCHLVEYANYIKQSTDPNWSNKKGTINISRCLKGLKGLPSHLPEVKAVLEALTPKIMACRELDAQAIGNALYGLQKMEACDEVKAVLSAFTPKIANCREEIPLYACALIIKYNESYHLNLEQELSNYKTISSKVDGCINDLSNTLSTCGVLDLHNLSHDLAANALRAATFNIGNMVIYGRSLHSKHAENLMKDITHKHLDNCHITYQDDVSGGACIIGEVQECIDES